MELEENKKYLIVYQLTPNDRDRAKKLIFRRNDGNFIVFFNEETQREEAILEAKIIRWEKIADGV